MYLQACFMNFQKLFKGWNKKFVLPLNQVAPDTSKETPGR